MRRHIQRRIQTIAQPSALLQRAAGPGPSVAPPIVHEVLRSPGQPLDRGIRSRMEHRFGRDFSSVTVHTGGRAAASARAVDARAYAIGRHVVFDASEYAPTTRSGLGLLAHELMHVVQQRAAKHVPATLQIGSAADPAERGAEAGGSAHSIAEGGVLRRQARTPAVGAASAGVPFHPGVAHDHKPTKRWDDVQADARRRCRTVQEAIRRDPKGAVKLGEEAAIECACAYLSPSQVVTVARRTVMIGLPLAQQHLDHYLDGSGSVMHESVEDLVTRDQMVRAKLAAATRRARSGHIRVAQTDYAVRDFQFAFGAIDRLDFKVDRSAGVVRVWFQDRYEWHPVGFGYSRFADDHRRDTNCVHAALVELKDAGARDYWMIGSGTLPLDALAGGKPASNEPAPSADL